MSNKSQTILLVEDDNDVAEIVSEMLSHEYEVACAPDADAAIAAVEADTPAVVLSDCLLPNGGLDRLLAKADAAGAPVVLMSGCTATLNQFSDDGYRILQKPFRVAELMHAVENAIAAYVGERS